MSQFTSEQRYKLEALLQQNRSKIEIAKYFGKHIFLVRRMFTKINVCDLNPPTLATVYFYFEKGRKRMFYYGKF